ncbi:hypothetical protein ACFSJY_18190 [Thalassotalea euphylliae]|uniref:hypothetical protein n=1 Tax=Thalassotalea euphylliae TaxID=1655234 RepID=UPI003644BBFD
MMFNVKPTLLHYLIITVVVIWCVSDYLQNYASNSTLGKSQFIAEAIEQELNFSRLSGESKQLIISQYSKYKKENEPSDSKQKSLVKKTAAELASQNGLLTEVFTDNEKIKLRAILVDKQKGLQQAYLEVTQIDSNDKKFETFNDQSEVYGFKLTIIDAQSLVLSKSNAGKQQNIEMKMYQKD